jgi:RES domain-containing protein
MLVYRIAHKLYSSQLFASGLEGRWNSGGKKIVYAADSVALAFLENMIRRQSVGFNGDFKIMFIEIPDDLSIQTVKLEQLPKGWRDFRNYTKCQIIGDAWYDKGEKPVLKVPSAILPAESNFVINTTLVAFRKIKLIDTTELVPDQRIEEILKHYANK